MTATTPLAPPHFAVHNVDLGVDPAVVPPLVPSRWSRWPINTVALFAVVLGLPLVIVAVGAPIALIVNLFRMLGNALGGGF
ncbi:MAG TPA: hypothetical protein VNJ02_03815 [Vicinamibacterales bacterium]|nr:hypothetical protein [Vicinamibacterales bacterium]